MGVKLGKIGGGWAWAQRVERASETENLPIRGKNYPNQPSVFTAPYVDKKSRLVLGLVDRRDPGDVELAYVDVIVHSFRAP